MKKIVLVTLIFLSAVLLTGQGCVSVKQKSSSAPGADAGVWVSMDKGETWQQKTLMPTINGVRNLSDLSVTSLLFDPQDTEIIYWNAGYNGVFISYDSGNSWQDLKKIPGVPINDLSIDSKWRNTNYIAFNNLIFKSTDCCRNWRNIYIDVPGIAVNTVMADPLNSSRILAGLADGRIIKSDDGGLNWSLFKELKVSIKKIFYNPKKPKTYYLITNGVGMYRSIDSGLSWNKLEELDKIPGAANIYYTFFDQTKTDALFALTDAGFLRSEEEAKNWHDYKLLTPPGMVKVQAFTANPKNPDEVYYAAPNAFYKSNNGGITWITKPLPTTSIPVYLTTHPQNPNILYLGTLMVQPKKK